MKSIWYWLSYVYSWVKYVMYTGFLKSQDRLDYFEVCRFQLWNSAVSGSTARTKKFKVAEYGYESPQVWIYNVYFTKFRLKAEAFLPVRGIAWGRGTDADALEARLVQSEHYLSVSQVVDKVEFQTYVRDNLPRRFRFSNLWYQDIRSTPNPTPWSQLIYGSNSILGVVYGLGLVFFLSIILLLEILYLGLCIYSFRLGVSVEFSPVGSWDTIRAVWRRFQIWGVSILSPIFYVSYLVGVLSHVFVSSISDLFHFSYAVTARYIFRLGWFVLLCFDKYIVGPARIVFSSITPRYWIINSRFALLCRILWFGQGFNRFLYHYWYLHMFGYYLLRGFRSLSIVYVVIRVSSYFNLHLVISWLANYFVLIVLSIGYEGLLAPILISLLVISSFNVLFPDPFRFIRIPQAIFVASAMPGISYGDRRFVASFSAEFYKSLSYEGLSRRLKWWPLAKEVLSLKYMDKEETLGSDIDESRDLRSRLSKVPKQFKQKKLKVLIDYFFTARESVADHESESNLVRMSDSDIPYRGQLDDSMVVLRFLPDEFRFFQSNLTKLYYLTLVDSEELSGLSSRILLGLYRFDSQRGEPYGPNPYESEFMFRNSLSTLYVKRVSEFSRILKSKYFFLRVSSRFVPRTAASPFDELSWTLKKCLDKLVNAQFMPVWDSNCLSTINSWRVGTTEYPIRRSFDNSQNIFDSNFSRSLSFQSQSKLYASIDPSNRNSYISTAMYFQSQYDVYWSFKLNTNVFMTYVFEPKFYFARTSFWLPYWLFQNLSPNLGNYVGYQDDTGSLYNHVLLLHDNSGDRVTAIDVFYETLTRMVRFGHSHYDQYLSAQLSLELDYQVVGTNSVNPNTFSSGFADWANTLVFESVEKDRDSINKMVVDYLHKDLGLIPKSAMGDFQSLRANYFYQSFYSTYLHQRTSAGWSRFVVKGRAKIGNFATDVIGLFTHLVFVFTDDDRRAVQSPESRKHAAVFERIYWRKQRFLNRIKAVFRVFPSMRPAGIHKIYGLFIAAAYIYTHYSTYPLAMRTMLDAEDIVFQPKEGDELWSFFMDCGVFILYWLLTWF